MNPDGAKIFLKLLKDREPFFEENLAKEKPWEVEISPNEVLPDMFKDAGWTVLSGFDMSSLTRDEMLHYYRLQDDRLRNILEEAVIRDEVIECSF
ncbi:MAG: hypothetical protein O6949_01745 [Chloroflexi bacterium]|nr:hypothetical protein [Chloroflexota bacterium]